MRMDIKSFVTNEVASIVFKGSQRKKRKAAESGKKNLYDVYFRSKNVLSKSTIQNVSVPVVIISIRCSIIFPAPSTEEIFVRYQYSFVCCMAVQYCCPCRPVGFGFFDSEKD